MSPEFKEVILSVVKRRTGTYDWEQDPHFRALDGREQAYIEGILALQNGNHDLCQSKMIEAMQSDDSRLAAMASTLYEPIRRPEVLRSKFAITDDQAAAVSKAYRACVEAFEHLQRSGSNNTFALIGAALIDLSAPVHFIESSASDEMLQVLIRLALVGIGERGPALVEFRLIGLLSRLLCERNLEKSARQSFNLFLEEHLP